jgi:hypothetical protein
LPLLLLQAALRLLATTPQPLLIHEDTIPSLLQTVAAGCARQAMSAANAAGAAAGWW